MPNSVRKISRRAENHHNLPNMLHSQTLKLSTTRQRVRIAVAMCEATIAPDLPTERVNWSSGMRYGGGGVAKGGHDCRYRMHEIGVCRPRRESVHFTSGLRAPPSPQPRIQSPNRLVGSALTYSSYSENYHTTLSGSPRSRSRPQPPARHSAADLPNMPHSQTLKLSTTRQRAPI